jgi:hypothetical protein
MLDFRYRIAVRTDDVAVLHCLRGLVHLCQKRGSINTGWGGTGQSDWRAANHEVTFKFTDPDFRAQFVREAERLFPSSLWSNVAEWDERVSPRISN